MATPYIGVYATSYPEYVLSGAAPSAPTISSFSPTSGLAGSALVITGTNFTGATLVSVNSGAVASFTVNSATQITAVLTSAQTTGLLRVTTPGGTAVSSGSFTVTTNSVPPSNAPVGAMFSPNSLIMDAAGNLQYPSAGDRSLVLRQNTNPDQGPAGDPAFNDTLCVMGPLWQVANAQNQFRNAGIYGFSFQDVAATSDANIAVRYQQYGWDSMGLSRKLLVRADSINTFNQLTYETGSASYSDQTMADRMLALMQADRARMAGFGATHFLYATGTDIKEADTAKNARYARVMDLLSPMMGSAFGASQVDDIWREDYWLGKGGHDRAGAYQAGASRTSDGIFRDEYHHTTWGALRLATRLVYASARATGQTVATDLTTATATVSGTTVTGSTNSRQAVEYNLRDTTTNALLLPVWQPWPKFTNVAGTCRLEARLAYNTAVVVYTAPFTIGGGGGGTTPAEEAETPQFVADVIAFGDTVSTQERAVANAFIKACKAKGYIGSAGLMEYGWVVGMPSPEVAIGASVTRNVRQWGVNSKGRGVPALDGTQGSADSSDQVVTDQSYIDPSADGGKGAVIFPVYTIRFAAPLKAPYFHMIRGQIGLDPVSDVCLASMSNRPVGVTVANSGLTAAYGDFGMRLRVLNHTNNINFAGSPSVVNTGDYIKALALSVNADTGSWGRINGTPVGIERAHGDEMSEDRPGWGFDVGKSALDGKLTHYLVFGNVNPAALPTEADFDEVIAAVNAAKP